MADSGDLGKLPPEIRKEIYSYLLVEPTKVGILRQLVNKKAKVARMDHHRNKKHRKQIYDRDTRKWKKAPPCITSLLLVNKLTSQEAAQVLYGFNKFEFLHAAALETFLHNIGPCRQYLRDITIFGKGLFYKGVWAAMDRSLGLLSQTPSLRSIEISHVALCGNFTGVADKNLTVTPEELVRHCKTLLESLKATFENQNLNLSIFDVIRIVLPRCAYDNGSQDSSHRQNHKTDEASVAQQSRIAESQAVQSCALCVLVEDVVDVVTELARQGEEGFRLRWLGDDGGRGEIFGGEHDVRQCLFCDFLMLHDSVSVETGFVL
jgi:hypothetical protein